MEIKTLNLLISPNGVFQIIQDISWAKVIETYEHSVLIIHTPSSGPGGGPKLKKQTNNWRETPLGRCDYLVMSYGLTSAPAFSKHSFNDVLRDMLDHSGFVYLDDILILSPTYQADIRKVMTGNLKFQLW